MYQYKLMNLGCANCAEKMVSKIRKIKGVESAEISFMTSKLFISFEEENKEKILEEVKKIISKIESQCHLEV